MTRSLGAGAKAAGCESTATIMHDIEDYHITSEQAARIANDVRVKHLVFYHLLPGPDGFLAPCLFTSMYTLPVGLSAIGEGRVR